LTTFFLAATACNAELAHRRPPASHLTEFYLMISVGGLLGGLFNALIAPVIFTSVAEYPLSLALAVFLVPAAGARAARRSAIARVLDLVLPLLLGMAADATLRGSVRGISPGASIFVSLAACLLFVMRPLRFALALAIVGAVIAHYQDTSQHVAFKERSFFGMLRVLVDFPKGVNTLMHGRTIHGMQRRSLDVSIRSMPLTYYFPTGPVGQLFESYHGTSVVERVGVPFSVTSMIAKRVGVLSLATRGCRSTASRTGPSGSSYWTPLAATPSRCTCGPARRCKSIWPSSPMGA
jgi:hypothetical protein